MIALAHFVAGYLRIAGFHFIASFVIPATVSFRSFSEGGRRESISFENTDHFYFSW